MKMFEPCEKCGSFGSRFEYKPRFVLHGEEDYMKIGKEKFGDYEGKRLCLKCFRKLNRKEQSLWRAYMFVFAMKKAFDAGIKCGGK